MEMKDPLQRHVDQRLRSALDLLEQDRLSDAERELGALAQSHPGEPQAWHYLGICLERQGQSGRALWSFLRAAETAGDWALPWYRAGCLQESAPAKNLPDATTFFAKAASLAPDWFDARFRLAVRLWRRGERDLALREAEALAVDFPDNPSAISLRGTLRFALKRTDAALADFIHLRDRWAELPEWAAIAAARLFLAVGHHEHLRSMFNHLLAKRTLGAAAAVKVARMALRAGEADACRDLCKRTLDADPRNVSAHLLMARYFEERHEFVQAAEHLKSVCMRTPGDGARRVRLAMLYVLADMHVAADAVLRSAPADGSGADLVAELRIRLMLRHDRAGEALATVDEAIARLGASVSLVVLRARALAAMGRVDEARDILYPLREEHPADVEVNKAVVSVLTQMTGLSPEEQTLLVRCMAAVGGAGGGRKGPPGAFAPAGGGASGGEGGGEEGGGGEGGGGETFGRPRLVLPRTGWRADLRSFLGSLSEHTVVVAALMRREMRTRFSRDSLGYLWALIEPAMLVAIFYGLFTAMERPPPFGMTMLTFLASGLVPWYMFQNTLLRTQMAVRQNVTLLYFPQVKPLDLFTARAVLELGTLAIVCIILFGIAYTLEPVGPIQSLLGAFAAMVLAWLMGTGMGMCVAAAMTWFNGLDKIVGYVTRVMFFTCGVFFTANELPAVVRDVLQFNPMFHVIDAMRAALFYDYHAEGSAMTVTLVVAVVSVFLGLLGESVARQRFHL